MARGRPAVPKAATKFMNKKHRVIMMTAEGKYLVKTDKGTAYNPKAAYVKSPGGTVRRLANSSARVPTAIRPKAVRKVRSNRRVARPHVQGMGLARLYRTPKPLGRPRKVMASPMWNLPNPYLRKVRKNKGAKRGPRGLALLARTIAKM
jgi:hypothetical protein